jgi:hypothetical protein
MSILNNNLILKIIIFKKTSIIQHNFNNYHKNVKNIKDYTNYNLKIKNNIMLN